MKEALAIRGQLAKALAHEDYVGWSLLEQADLVHSGRRARGVIVELGDTGWTINNDPRVDVTIRVEPVDEPPFEVTRRLTVSRLEIPRKGERVEVAYDPGDRSRFTFRVSDLTDER
jgi:hypothetical protein